MAVSIIVDNFADIVVQLSCSRGLSLFLIYTTELPLTIHSSYRISLYTYTVYVNLSLATCCLVFMWLYCGYTVVTLLLSLLPHINHYCASITPITSTLLISTRASNHQQAVGPKVSPSGIGRNYIICISMYLPEKMVNWFD